MRYVRPITGSEAPDALALAGGPCRFDRVELIERGRAPHVAPVAELTPEETEALVAPRPALAGLAMDRPRIMGILNTTPDSFSDGGRHLAPEAAGARVAALAAEGAEIIDIGGESTRPGAEEVPAAEEARRTAPALIAAQGLRVSIDTRKSQVARAAIDAGAAIVNDVSALAFDPEMAGVVAASRAALVLMHSRGTPQDMQERAVYADPVLDVYDALAERIDAAVAAGIARERLVIDPGIGFAKTLCNNLAILRRVAIFHSLGATLLLGASRKRFIGTISGADAPEDRMPGSVAIALHGAAQGVQVLRVHDVRETRQALALWGAVTRGRT